MSLWYAPIHLRMQSHFYVATTVVVGVDEKLACQLRFLHQAADTPNIGLLLQTK